MGYLWKVWVENPDDGDYEQQNGKESASERKHGSCDQPPIS